MQNKTFTFHFRKQENSEKTLALIEAIGYAGKIDYLNAAGEVAKEGEAIAAIKRQSQTPTVEVVTLDELASSEQGLKVLELMLEKTITELVRSDFDGGKNPLAGWIGGVVPEGYAITTEYLLESLTPSVSGGSSAAVKVADIKAFFIGMEQWLVSAGKKPAAVALYKSVIEGRFKESLIQGLSEAYLNAIHKGFTDYVETLQDADKEEQGEVIAYIDALAVQAIAGKKAISVDDL